MPHKPASAEKDAGLSLTVKDIKVTRGLAKDDALKTVQAHLSEIEKYCAGSGLPGDFVLKMTLNADGTVKDVQVLSGISSNDQARQCIIGQVKKWKFPAAKDGRKVTVTVTLS
jgi:outer membrane biosynthesis protein TonB